MATGAEFKPRTLIESTLGNQPIADGTLYVTTDTKRLYIDVDQSRILVDGNIYLETEAQKNMILAPLSNKLYIVKASKTMYLYTSEGWVTLGGSSGEGGTSNYEELTNLPMLNGVELVGDKSLADLGIQGLSDEDLATSDKTVVGAINEIKTTFDEAVVTPQATYSNPAIYLGKDFTTTVDNAIETLSLNGGANTILASELEIAEDGYYVVSADLLFADSSKTAGKRILCNMLLNGVTFAQNIVTTQSSNANNILTITGVANCSKGNKFTLQVANGLTGTLNITLSKFSAVRVYSPFDLDRVNSDLTNLQDTSANIDLANLSTAGIDVIKSYAGGSSDSNTTLAVNPFSYGMSSYFTSDPDSSCWTKADDTFISNAKYYDWLEKIQSGALSVEGVSVKLHTETYSEYDFAINPTDRTFRLPLLNGSEDLMSSREETLTLLPTGSDYIAPANGWFYIMKVGKASEKLELVNRTNNIDLVERSRVTSEGISLIMQATRNDTVLCAYTASGDLIDFKFIYAQGNGSLYYYTGATENTLSEDVEELKSQMGDLSTILDNINGEIV